MTVTERAAMVMWFLASEALALQENSGNDFKEVWFELFYRLHQWWIF